MTIYDDDMRTIIDLPEEQVKALSVVCQRERISRAEAIRRAVTKLLEETGSGDAEEAFGLWKHKKLDARKYVERLRAEWKS